MLVTEFGIVTVVKPVQYWNAPYPTEVTELGIDTEVIFLQDLNAKLPMPVTL
jgi:hypothetical protein